MEFITVSSKCVRIISQFHVYWVVLKSSKETDKYSEL